jgi:hypothetical protein
MRYARVDSQYGIQSAAKTSRVGKVFKLRCLDLKCRRRINQRSFLVSDILLQRYIIRALRKMVKEAL